LAKGSIPFVCNCLWSMDTSHIRCVLVSDTRRCPVQHRHLWLHWIMSFFQIVTVVDKITVLWWFYQIHVIPNMDSLFHNYKMRLPTIDSKWVFVKSIFILGFTIINEGKLDYLKISFKLENPKKKSWKFILDCVDVNWINFFQVFVRMDSNSKPIDEKLQVKPAQKVTFCQREKSGNGSFVSKLRDHFHEFIRASADEHKRCLRNTIQKVYFLLWMYIYIY
jgi:hypothetical protein